MDSQARNTAQDNLSAANSDLFAQTQKQILNLMKFDSYQRFIRSDLYKRCLDAEENNLPLPYPGDQHDIGLRTGPLNATHGGGAMPAGKLKKSLSNAEDRRRKSLLPWHRKQRCKSKDRQESSDVKSMLFASTSSIPKALAAAVAGGNPLAANSELASSRSSLSSFDAVLLQQQRYQHGGEQLAADGDCSKRSLCRVLLADGATTIVQTRSDESIRDMIERLLEKRGIVYRAFEAFLLTANGTSNKQLNLDEPSASIAGKELTVDQRIVFKLDLPNRKIISVKSKTTKALEDVLRPILNKYNYRLDLVQVSTRDCSAPLDMAQSVQETDGQRLQVILKSSEMLDEEESSPESPLPNAAMLSPQRALFYGGHQRSSSHGGYSPPAYLPPPVPYDLQQHPSAVVANAVNAEASVQLQQQLHHQYGMQSAAHHGNASLQQQHHHHHHQRQTSYPQSHLDEITNKVFNELLQEKVVSQQQQQPMHHHQHTNHQHHGAHHSQQLHPQHQQQQQLLQQQATAVAAAAEHQLPHIDAQSTRSAEWDTESGSSRFDRLRRNNAKKMEFLSRGATEMQPQLKQQLAADAEAHFAGCDAGKRPLIAKWKAGVKLQVTHKSDNHGKSRMLRTISTFRAIFKSN